MIFATVRDILAVIGGLTVFSAAAFAAWTAFCWQQQRRERRRKSGARLNRGEKRVLDDLARTLSEGKQ